jgi:AcrR family transcriptional regulator
MSATTPDRPKRADAVRNRERVVQAAAQALAELGPDVSIDDVAARAGVGRATVYRCFPTKDHLIAAVAIERLARFEQMADLALEEADAGAAFRELLVAIAESNAKDRIMLGALRLATEIPELAAARAATSAALDRLMRSAKKQGSMRRDATPEDVRVLFSGLTHALTGPQQRDAKLWRRYANLIADALLCAP